MIERGTDQYTCCERDELILRQKSNVNISNRHEVLFMQHDIWPYHKCSKIKFKVQYRKIKKKNEIINYSRQR